MLIGFSCTGKSSVGGLLAKRLRWKLIDTDDLIVTIAGKPIHRIFADDGEMYFRSVERAAVMEACAGAQRVIASGGGAPVAVENRHELFRSSLVVGLHANPETILERLLGQLSDGSVRPLLAAPDPKDRISTLLTEREAVYALAHLAINTDALTPEQVTSAILDHLEAATNIPTASMPGPAKETRSS